MFRELLFLSLNYLWLCTIIVLLCLIETFSYFLNIYIVFINFISVNIYLFVLVNYNNPGACFIKQVYQIIQVYFR